MFEGIIPTIKNILKNYVVRQHIMRYVFASNYVKDKVIVDVACGTGYGSHYLALQGARYTIAIDLDIRALLIANKYYSTSNLDYVCGDAKYLPLRSDSIEVFISFETIEHLDKPTLFINEITRTLKPSGTLIISTPNKRWTMHPPYHLHEFYPDEFYKLLKGYFAQIERYAQYISYKQLLKDMCSRLCITVMRFLRLSLIKMYSLKIKSKMFDTIILIMYKFVLSNTIYNKIIKKINEYYDNKFTKINDTIVKLLERYEDCKVVPFRSRRKPLRIMIAVCKVIRC